MLGSVAIKPPPAIRVIKPDVVSTLYTRESVISETYRLIVPLFVTSPTKPRGIVNFTEVAFTAMLVVEPLFVRTSFAERAVPLIDPATIVIELALSMSILPMTRYDPSTKYKTPLGAPHSVVG